MPKGTVVFACLRIWFGLVFPEWFDTVSHTMMCMQERGHMHIDDIVQHADKFQVNLCSPKWEAPAFLSCCVCANGLCVPCIGLP